MNDESIPGDEDMHLPVEFRRKEVSPHQQQKNWQAIESRISSVATPARRGWKVAAFAMATLAIIAVLVFTNSGDTKNFTQYKTGFAQTKRLILPDGSTVILNANSSLRITATWNDQAEREVWLEGEAYFEVEKKPATKQKFVVHAKDIDVEVLGTRFNMNTRHEQSTVSLEEGKVKLSAKGSLQTILEHKKKEAVIEMKPGDVVKADTLTGLNTIIEDEVEKNSGWVRNEWHFDSTTLKEIAVMIEDVYGYKTEVADEQLLAIPISGDLRAANINELIAVLQFTSKLTMIKEKRTIKMSRP